MGRVLTQVGNGWVETVERFGVVRRIPESEPTTGFGARVSC